MGEAKPEFRLPIQTFHQGINVDANREETPAEIGYRVGGLPFHTQEGAVRNQVEVCPFVRGKLRARNFRMGVAQLAERDSP